MSNQLEQKDPYEIVNSSVAVSWNTRNKLLGVKERNESFNDVIKKLVEAYEKKDK